MMNTYMERQRKFIRIFGMALATELLLLVPLVAMLFTDAVVWSASDFVVAGALLFVTGFLCVSVMSLAGHILYRMAMLLAIGTTFLMIWANLAVGLIGSGPHMGNLLYIGILVIAVTGTFLSHLKPAGMKRAMYATTLGLVLLAIVELLAKMYEYPGSSVMEIVSVNGFFALLYAVAGLLFRHVSLQQSPAK